MSDIELTQLTQGKADIVIKNKNFFDKKNNKITEINISPNNMMPTKTDVKFNIFINGKQYSIPYDNNVLPCIDRGCINEFLQKIENYFQNEDNKKFFVEKGAKCLKEQIEQINEENNKIMPKEHQNNNNIINHNKELSIIDENEELLYYNNNIVIDDKHITEAEDKKHTALNTNKKIERQIEKEKQINKENNKIMPKEHQNNNDIINHNKELNDSDIENVEDGEITQLPKTLNCTINNRQNNNTTAQDEITTSGKKIEKNNVKQPILVPANDKTQQKVGPDEKTGNIKVNQNRNTTAIQQKNDVPKNGSMAMNNLQTKTYTYNEARYDTRENNDHYIARAIRHCLSYINCDKHFTLDDVESQYWERDNSPYIFR